MAFPATFQSIQNDVIARLNLDATNDLASVKDYINVAYADVCATTEALETSGTKTLTAGTASYDVTTFVTGAIHRIKALTYTSGGVTYPPLVAVSLDELLRLRVGTGGTAVATGPAIRYAMVGAKTIELWPTPGAADTLTIYYSYLPTALSANSDTPDAGLPEPYASQCLTFGALKLAADLTGDPAGADYDNKYALWTQKLQAHLNRRRSGQPGQMRPFPSYGFPPHDPSTISPWGGGGGYGWDGY